MNERTDPNSALTARSERLRSLQSEREGKTEAWEEKIWEGEGRVLSARLMASCLMGRNNECEELDHKAPAWR